MLQLLKLVSGSKNIGGGVRKYQKICSHYLLIHRNLHLAELAEMSVFRINQIFGVLKTFLVVFFKRLCTHI